MLLHRPVVKTNNVLIMRERNFRHIGKTATDFDAWNEFGAKETSRTSDGLRGSGSFTSKIPREEGSGGR